MKGDGAMNTYEAIYLTIMFVMLVIALIDFKSKNNRPVLERIDDYF